MPLSTVETNLIWLAASGAVEPDAAGWTKVGTGTTAIVGAGFQVVDASAVERTLFWRTMSPRDKLTAKARGVDTIEAQFRATVSAYVAGWGSGASGAGFYVDDGARALAVSIGSALALIDPNTGDVVAPVAAAWSYAAPHSYLLRKRGQRGWELWVDGVRLASLPYAAAPASPGRPTAAGWTSTAPALVAWGSLDIAGTATAVFDLVENALNMAVAPQSKVDRARLGLPVALQNRWTDTAEAVLRTTLGMVEGVVEVLGDAWASLGGGQTELERATFTGARLPDAEPTSWTLTSPGNFAVVRDRVRASCDGLAATEIEYDFTGSTSDPQPEFRGRVELTLRSYTPDAAFRAGPQLVLYDGTRAVAAQLFGVPADSQFAWVLTDLTLTGGPPTSLGPETFTDALSAHTIELEIDSGSDGEARLIVDGEIVGSVPYTSLPASAHAPGFLVRSDVGPACVWDAEDGRAARVATDQSRRPMYSQLLLEWLFALGGQERNDVLEAWRRRLRAMHRRRGTTEGLEAELRRITGVVAHVVRDLTPGDWYLEVTWPDITPIYLEFDGDWADIYVEFAWGAVTLSPPQLAIWAARYLVPISSLELRYHVCLYVAMTAGQSHPTADTTRFTVTTSSGFAVGDTVTARDAANSTHESGTVTAVTTTTIDVNFATVYGYAAGDIVRKILADS